jgi:ABC-2 type transport system ATP-binding protein
MEPCLELHGLRRSFGQLVAVDGLSFTVPAGRLFGFVGRNGAGKTTTMRIICGLLAPDRGSASWRGTPIDGRVRELIGYVPEERGLYPKMRLADQLEYFAVLHGASHRRGRAAALSCQSGLDSASASWDAWRRCRTETSSAFSSPPRSCISPTY